MKQNNNLLQPSIYADQVGQEYARKSSTEQKKKMGQFFTPIPIANLMASFSSFSGSSIKILDAGCGMLVLSCSLIEKLVSSNKQLKHINLVCYDSDINIKGYITDVFDNLKQWLRVKQIDITFEYLNVDFVIDSCSKIKSATQDKFDIIISNPPYFKLPKNDLRVTSSKTILDGHANIYTLFMSASANRLKKGGEAIFITPRSFAAGNYFSAFRSSYFGNMSLTCAHLFDSRSNTFERDKVLQEMVITRVINSAPDKDSNVTISSSYGLNDIATATIRKYKLRDIVDLKSEYKIIHLPTSDIDDTILSLVNGWKNTLSDFNINISTGKVVSFRAKEYVREDYSYDIDLVPLFWLNNVNKMDLNWPINVIGKGQFILDNSESKSILIPNRNYILLRRFSTKDDKSRLIAAPYFCNHTKVASIGVENKLNYIYRKDGHLDRSEVVGICALLNSSLADLYFQIFNGNVNVSATELRIMKFPLLSDIKHIGNNIILSNDYTVPNINREINKYFNLTQVI